MGTTKRNYFFNLLLTGFNILFPVISFPYAAKILGPVGIGKVQFILSYSQYFALIAALGIPIYGIRIISQAANDKNLMHKSLSELLSIHIMCGLIVTIIYGITIYSFPFFKHDRPLYVLSGIIILIGFTSIDWYFSGIENFKLIAIRSVLVKMISLAGLFVFVKYKSDYNIYLLISIFSILGNNLINIFAIRKYIKFSLNGIKKHFKPLMFTFGTTIATSMYTILDTVLIGFFADEKSVGLYSASVKLTKISIPIILSIGTVLIPRISKLFGTEDFDSLNIILNKSFNFIVIMAIPVCLGLLMLAPQLIYVFSGVQFNDAVLTMQILSPLTLIIGLGNFWGFQILFPAGKEREMLISVIIGMVVNLTLNIILIPLYKQNGAAIANVVSELMVTGSFMFFCLKIIKFKISHQAIINNIFASLPLIFIVLFFKLITANIYCQLILSVFSFMALYFFIQVKLLKNSIINELILDYLKRR